MNSKIKCKEIIKNLKTIKLCTACNVCVLEGIDKQLHFNIWMRVDGNWKQPSF